MAFPDDIVKQSWERASAQCECIERTHSHHYIPCAKYLVWEKRGKNAQGGWEAYQINPEGGFTQANCEILCWTCYEVKSLK